MNKNGDQEAIFTGQLLSENSTAQWRGEGCGVRGGGGGGVEGVVSVRLP